MKIVMQKLYIILKLTIYILKVGVAFIISRVFLLSEHYRDIWLVSERGDDARDNGWFFFKYVKEKYPEVNVYYVIDCKSSDFEKIQTIGKFIHTNSFKHYVYFMLAKVRISTHIWGGDIPGIDYYYKLRFNRISKKKQVFLQHGITKDYQPGLCYPNVTPNLFVCGAKPEFDYIKDAFGHPENVVCYTGFARFDNLHVHEEKYQILIMPTFRKWLQGITVEEFEDSEYFRAWNHVLNDTKIHDMLKKNNLNLVFYPHYEMQKFVSCFKSSCKNVIIADFAHYDVQQLLMESKLLITDFSSVFFDFAYMKKPVLYYHFDRPKYIQKHYDFTKGYFSYDDNGFGEVVFDAENLIEYITKYIVEDFRLSDEYIERGNEFFTLHDEHNSERIFAKIQEIISEEK